VKKIQFARLREAPEVAGTAVDTCRATGAATSRRLGFEGFPLWSVRTDLAAGAALVWDGRHGDEGLYVLEGELVVDGRVCPTGGAIVVEADVAATIEAPGGASVVHVGPTEPVAPADGLHGPPATEGRSVHVVGPEGTYATVEGTRGTRMFLDSTCPTCRISFFVSGRPVPNTSAIHTHSADEIISVLHGELRFGSQRLGPGDAVAIVGGQQYGFSASGGTVDGDGQPSGGYAFLNYRRDASMMQRQGAEPFLEGGAATGMTYVGDLR
jgi:quercetin dioxygenase-like cupin family protein